MATLPLRQIEGKYEILEKMKEGGMGALYKVRHLLLDEIRVIKVIRPQISDSQDLQRRFAREAKAAIRLKHPNIAQLYDFAVEPDGVAYMVMEFIDGVTLQEMLARNGPAPLDLTLDVARQSLEALRYLHHQGYVHRDVAPDNLMLTKDFSGQPLVKLIDLGIVKHLAGGGEGLTATGTFLGKVRYSSPEQFSGEKGGVDHRSDLYSFGVMLYELLTGKCPIVGENLSQLVSAHLFQAPRSFEQTDPEGRVPEDIRAAVMKSLEKVPDKRIGSAQEFQTLLERQPSKQSLSRDLEVTLSTTIRLRTLVEQVQPGTTQDRLDAQFGLERTPGPGPGLRAADAVPEGDREQLKQLFDAAKQLAQESKWEEARRRLYQALAIDHDHQEVRTLLSSVETSLAQAIAEEKRRRGIAGVVERVDACLSDEQLEAASRELEQGRSEYGAGEEEFSRLEMRIAELRGVLAERARQTAIADAVAGIGAQLDAEQPDAAAGALGAAVERFGEDERFGALATRLADLSKRLEQRRREQEAAARRERARSLLADAAELAERRAFGEAIARAEEALALDPSPAAEQVLLGYRADEARRLEEIRRERALDQAVQAIQTSLQGERADAAARELDAAVASFGENARFEGLRAGLAALRRELEERERERARRQAIADAVSAVESHLARESADDAQRALEEATARLGGDARFEPLAKRIALLRTDLAERQRKREEEERRRREAELRRQEEERRRQEEERLRREAQARREQEERRRREEAEARRRRAQELLREAAKQAAGGELAQALETARAAADFDPEPARAAIERYQQELEVEARAKRLQQLLAAARTEIAAGAFESARSRLEAGRREHGADAEWRQLLSTTEAEIERQAAERRRQETVAAEAAAVERLIGKGRRGRAEERLAKARARLGDEASLVELGRRLESLRLEEQRRAPAAMEVTQPLSVETRRPRGAKPLYWAAAAGAVLALGVAAWSVWSWSSGSASLPVAEVGEVRAEVDTESLAAPGGPSIAAGSAVPRAGLDVPAAAPQRERVQEETVGSGAAAVGETVRSSAPPAAAPAERTEAVQPRTARALEPSGAPAVGASASAPIKPSVVRDAPPEERTDRVSRSAASPNPRPGSAAPSTSPSTAERVAPVEAIELATEPLPVPAKPRPTAVVVSPPPAPQRVAEPAPPAPAPRTPADRDLVLATLERYRVAYERLDAGAVARVFTGANEHELRRAFRQYKSVTLNLAGCKIALDGETATATCDVVRTIIPKAGERISRSQRETFQLRKVGPDWVVEKLG